MPEISEGLETPDARENVNTQDGFEAALARSAGVEVPKDRPATVSTDIAAGLETEGTVAQPRTPSGQFVPEDAEEEEETPEEEEEGSADELSPEVQELLSKHDGDEVAALKELHDRFTNAQSLIGRQGNDLGKMREEMAELRGMIQEQRAATPQARPSTPLSTDQASEVAEDIVGQYGYYEAAKWAANNDPTVYDAVINAWALESPISAQRFDLDFQLWKRDQATERPADPSPDEWVESQKQTAAINVALDAVRDESEDWETFSPHLQDALGEVPKRVAAMVASDDPEERLDGVRAVADKARVLALRSGKGAATLTPEQKAAQEAVQQTRVDAKKRTAIATGSQRPVTPGKSSGEEMTSEERVKTFKEKLLATESTSVNEGLTYAKT